MLKGIPRIISPELLKVLCEMGHGDTIVLADGNFPAQTIGRDGVVLHMDGCGIEELLEAILQVFPLDTYIAEPVTLMQVVPGDPVETPIWDSYQEILIRSGNEFALPMKEMERFEFYSTARKAFAVVATSEKAQYANMILQKGVVV